MQDSSQSHLLSIELDTGNIICGGHSVAKRESTRTTAGHGEVIQEED